MVDTYKKVKVKTPDYNIAAIGEVIVCEPLLCTFCGKHICPATNKTYFSFPFLDTEDKIALCSVKCVKIYYAGKDWEPSRIDVVEEKK